MTWQDTSVLLKVYGVKWSFQIVFLLGLGIGAGLGFMWWVR